ncbi:protein of unknown function DUF202 [Cellulomonas gilvus ATCC 13127]|uniref:DUF202 domain-containing protein n=2 Tax=Cellulomonadaceae TaxID=85016 RepID=F8A271_CELGA|nr:protein of unknown function DUF202 [Cellulomonas gilvus ATCC 13127]
MGNPDARRRPPLGVCDPRTSAVPSATMGGMTDAPDRRFPAHVYATGEDPDPRFSLANERTFLAWVRTALALLAAGVALEALDLPVRGDLRLAAATLLVALGTALPVLAWWEWGRTEKAMREHRRLPGPRGFAVLVVGVAVAGLLVLVGLVVA